MGLLRQFTSLTNSASVSIFTYPCNITNLDGTLVSTSTTPCYLQIFDKASAPVANDVPIASYELPTAAPFPLVSIFQNVGAIPLALGFGIGISQVHQKYTAATATYDVFGQIEEGYQQSDGIPSLSTVGDTTTHVDGLAVWADGDNNNADRLVRIYVSNVSGAIRYLMLFSSKSGSSHPVDGDRPQRQWKLAIGATTNFYFGSDGMIPTQVFATDGGSALPNVSQYGCFLISSSTTTTLLSTSDTSLILKAWYRTS